MKLGYIDTSCLVTIAFGERGHSAMIRHLAGFDRLVADNLAEAEFRATLEREGMPQDRDEILSSVSWLLPDRPLTAEYRAVLALGYARGADLRHLACALYFAADLAPLWFLTADSRQKRLAKGLGFAT